jgi:hypothetical protein
MLRRVVVLLLVPVVLVPWAGIAHAHAGCSIHDPAGLDRAPHFHLRVLCQLSQSCTDDDDCSQTLDWGTPSPDHDDDAVYVPTSVILGRLSEHAPAVAPDRTALLLLMPDIFAMAPVAALSTTTPPLSPDAGPDPPCLRSLPLLI